MNTCISNFTVSQGEEMQPSERHCPVLNLLLLNGANSNAKNKRGQTPLFCAIR